MPWKMFQAVLYLFVMHDGYKKLIGFQNFIKHCDWFNLCQKFQFLRRILKIEKNDVDSFQDVLKTYSRGLEEVLKISCRRFCKTSWRRFGKTSSRHFEDVLKMSWTRFCKTPWRRLENNLKTSLQDVLNTSWRRMTNENIFVLIKTSWRRPEDGLWRRRQKMSSRRLQGAFLKTNEDVLKMPWRCLANIFARHLEDVLKAL